MGWMRQLSTFRAGTHREIFEANGVPISYRVKGEGAPVILVHGVAANSNLNWNMPGIRRALARDYQVITFDNRGHGRSGKPHGEQYYGMEMVEDVVRLMDHLQIEKAHVIGYSMGGFITLKLLTEHPDRLLTAAPCGAGWERRDGDSMKRLETIADAIESKGDYGPLLAEVGVNRTGIARVKMCVVSAFFRSINDEQAIADVMRSMPALEVSEAALRANTVPVLSIVGGADPLKRGVDNMEGILANHEIVVVPRGSHYTTLRKKQMICALRDFLKRHGGPTKGHLMGDLGPPSGCPYIPPHQIPRLHRGKYPEN